MRSIAVKNIALTSILSLSLSMIQPAVMAAGGDENQPKPTATTPATPAPGGDASATPAQPSAPQAAGGADAANEVSPDSDGKILYKPGQTVSVDTATEDITPTYDVALAEKQVAAYPDNPEASFILAVALTRTSHVEDALKEVHRAQKLAENKGGPTYFDKMIDSYEKMLLSYPNENQARYELAWAYYMKAYLLSRYSRKVAAWKAANPQPATPSNSTAAQTTPEKAANATGHGDSNKDLAKALSGSPAAAAAAISDLSAKLASNKKPALDSIPHIPSALEKVDAPDVPQIKKYYELALSKLDELLKHDPEDYRAANYSAHLRADYTGDIAPSMHVWEAVIAKHPNDPAAYFFLGEAYLRMGNLKESINHVSRALALRALGN